jgi:hypothetical protein
MTRLSKGTLVFHTGCGFATVAGYTTPDRWNKRASIELRQRNGAFYCADPARVRAIEPSAEELFLMLREVDEKLGFWMMDRLRAGLPVSYIRDAIREAADLFENRSLVPGESDDEAVDEAVRKQPA